MDVFFAQRLNLEDDYLLWLLLHQPLYQENLIPLNYKENMTSIISFILAVAMLVFSLAILVFTIKL